MEENLRFKIDWASLVVGRKFTIFALFYFVFVGNFQIQAPLGPYIWRGDSLLKTLDKSFQTSPETNFE